MDIEAFKLSRYQNQKLNPVSDLGTLKKISDKPITLFIVVQILKVHD